MYNSTACVAVGVVVYNLYIFKSDLYVYVNVRKVYFFAIFGNEVTLFVEFAALVKLGYVALEFAVRKADGVLFGYITRVAVAVEFLRHYMNIVGADN